MTLDHVERIVPVLLLQDHGFRVPGLNWYMNQHFQERLMRHKLRSGIVVRPLTVIHIQDLESVVHSIERSDFDFISAIDDRVKMDTLGLSDIMDWFRQYEKFGHAIAAVEGYPRGRYPGLVLVPLSRSEACIAGSVMECLDG